MDSLANLIVALLPVLIPLLVLVVLLVFVRIARERYLRNVTLSDSMIRELQVELTENARRASLQPGMEIDLAPFWSQSHISEPNRRAIIHPLIEQHVFGWYVHRSNDAFENFLGNVAHLVWNPTRTKVYVSQWVTDKTEPTQLIIETLLGPLILGDVDNSTTYGHRAGRDVIIGDRVGHDKVAGNLTSTRAGGSVVGSGNNGPTEIRSVQIASEDALRDALQALAQQAASRGEQDDVVAALRWAAAMATSDQTPTARDQVRHQRVLDRASSWIRTSLGAIVEGVTGALTEHWLVELLRG